MSFQITEAFVKQFSDNVVIQAQQKGSRLRSAVRTENIHGTSKRFDRLGSVDMQQKAGRHSNTVQMDTPHSGRWCYLTDWVWADLIDAQDKVRILNSPESEYVMVAMFAAGRKMDDYVLKAVDMDVKTGEEADGTATHPNSQKIASCDLAGNATGMTVDTLRLIKRAFDRKEVKAENGDELHIAMTSNQAFDMLGDDRITNADYNNVKALVDGKVDTFMGFKFHFLERVLTQTSALTANFTTGEVGTGAGDVNGFRKVAAWAKTGIILGIGEDVVSRITERPDKDYATQAYIRMTLGSTRIEEEKTVIAFCKEA